MGLALPVTRAHPGRRTRDRRRFSVRDGRAGAGGVTELSDEVCWAWGGAQRSDRRPGRGPDRSWCLITRCRSVPCLYDALGERFASADLHAMWRIEVARRDLHYDAAGADAQIAVLVLSGLSAAMHLAGVAKNGFVWARSAVRKRQADWLPKMDLRKEISNNEDWAAFIAREVAAQLDVDPTALKPLETRIDHEAGQARVEFLIRGTETRYVGELLGSQVVEVRRGDVPSWGT